MDKDGTIIISNWHKEGMSDSPVIGSPNISNCEVFDDLGILKIANKPADDGVTHNGLPIARIKDVYGNVYVLTTDGVLKKNSSTLTSGLTNPYDLAILSDYLFVTHGTVVSIYGPLAGPAVWYGNQYTGLTSGYYHKMIVDENPDTTVGNYAVYITDGNLIKTIRSFVSQASPGTMSTGLTLPDDEYAVTLESLGSNLMIGTQGGSNWSDRTNHKKANIYPWSKAIAESFNKPVSLNENGVHSMISDNNRLFVVAGTRGNVYETDGTNYRRIKRLPWAFYRANGQTMKAYPNAIDFNQEGNLLIGTSTNQDSYDSSHPSRHGVYELKLSDTYPCVLKYTISTGNSGGSQVLNIGVVSAQGDTISIGWQDGSSYGLDITGFYTYSSYEAVFESKLYLVGTRLNRKTFQNLEFILTRPLITGQGVKIGYRKDLTADYTNIGTFDFATLGSVISHNTKALIDDAEILQLKIQLTQSATEALDNINLLAVRLW